jgi:hypothetical protein
MTRPSPRPSPPRLPLLLSLLALAAGTAACASTGGRDGEGFGPWGDWSQVAGNGRLTDRTAELSGDFDRVEAGLPIDVVVEEGAEARVEVRVDEDLQELVRVEVRGGTLHLTTRKPLRAARGARVRVVAPRLVGVDAAGTGEVEVAPRAEAVEAFELALSGTGDVRAEADAERLHLSLSGTGNLLHTGRATVLEASLSGTGDLSFQGRAREVRLSLSGTGDVRAAGEGTAERLVVDLSGTGNVDARALPARDVRVDSSGPGNTRVQLAGGTARLTASGPGDIEYWGEAERLQTHDDGPGQVRARR